MYPFMSGAGRCHTLALCLMVGTVRAQNYTSQPLPLTNDVYGSAPYAFTGVLTASSQMAGRLGSGAVVKHPRVVFSCAHVVFDEDAVDPWLTDVRWHRAYARLTPPSSSSSGAQSLRGFYYFMGYAPSARIGISRPETFDFDFVVHYAYEPTANGGYAGWWSDGAAQLTSTKAKIITGYPIGLYHDLSNDPRTFIMHQTGPFTRPFFPITDDYFGVHDVSAGRGNSGGPVWVSDGAEYFYAGVLVSGSLRSEGALRDGAGIYAVGQSSVALIDAALVAAGGITPSPTIIAHPTSRRVGLGSSVDFTVTAAGSSPAYRWLFNGAVVPGATFNVLSLRGVTAAHAGTYQAIVGNAGGEVRSAVATLSVDGSRLQNVSTRGLVLPGSSLTSGFVIRGVGSKQLLIRAVGPTLSQFGIAEALQDTRLEIVPSGSSVSVIDNDDWGGGAAISTLFASLGAFPLPPSSKDSAVAASLAGGAEYTVRVSSTDASGGVVIAEVYDADPESSTTRMVNVSSLGFSGTQSGALTAGFVIKGSGSKRLLVRAIGPGLGQFGVTSLLANPQVELVPLGSPTVLMHNDNWGGADSLKSAFAAAGAFAIPNDSLDSAVVATLPPGGYTVVISDVGGGQGIALVEIYDLDP